MPKDISEKLVPPTAEEKSRLEEYPFPEDLSMTSRLGCQVVLSKDMDGMVVFVPDGPDDDIP